MKTYRDVEDYISTFPKETQIILETIRTTIRKAAPKAEEVISYGMPGYKLHGALVYFGGYKKHIGFYAIPSGIAAFEKDLSAYKVSKGTVQFTIDKPMPLSLITKMVKYRVKENIENAKMKLETKKK